MNTEPNYKNYTLDELQETYSLMDTDAFQSRAEKIRDEIQYRLTENKSSTQEAASDSPHSEEYISPKGNWFKLHWKGLLPLDLSYWVNVFAVGIALVFISPPLFQYLAESEASSSARAFIIILFYIVITGISVWQLTGLYRSADKHSSRGGSTGWALVAKLMVLIGVTRYCYDMSQTGIPFILESGKIVVGISELPPLTIRVMNQGTEIELQGGLEFGTSAKLTKILASNPSVKVIHLNSYGGRLAEAKKLAAIVKKNKLITYSKTLCLSACPIVFLAG